MINKEGLRQKPSYNELIDEIATDQKIKLPDRRAKFMRDSPYLSFLDNETYLEMEDQQNKLNAQQQAQQTIQQVASSSGQTASVLRSQVTNPFGGGGTPPIPLPTPPIPPAPNPFGPGSTPPPPPQNQFGGGRTPETVDISTPNITPPIGPEYEASLMELESIFFGFDADQVPQMNVPQAVRPNVDVASLEGLYPSIEGAGPASSSATASQLAMQNVNQMLGTGMEVDARAKRNPEADADETPPASKAKSAPKSKAKAKAKAKAQAIENSGETGGTAIEVQAPEAPEASGTGTASASSSSAGPALPKAKAKASGIKKSIAKDTTPKAKPPDHGTKLERLSKRVLRGKNLGYMVDQMQLRGKKFLPTELKGKSKLTKNQLAEMILDWDAKNPPA